MGRVIVQDFVVAAKKLRELAIKCACGAKPMWYCWTEYRGQFGLCGECAERERKERDG